GRAVRARRGGRQELAAPRACRSARVCRTEGAAMRRDDHEDRDGEGARERVLDALLREVVGGETVPDLVSAVSAKLGEHPDAAPIERAETRSRRWTSAVAGLALGAAAAAAVVAWVWRPLAVAPARLVEWRIA